MKVNCSAGLTAIVVASLILGGCSSLQQNGLPWKSQPTAIPAPADPEIETGHIDVISAEGVVVPAKYVTLSFSGVGGVVDEVLVEEGERVQAGQVLARLGEREDIEAAISAVELELLAAQQELDTLYEEADLAAVQAHQVVIELQDDVKEAERIVQALNSPPSQDQIEAAKNAVKLAETAMNKTRKQFDSLNNRTNSEAVKLAAQLAVYAAEREYYQAMSYLNAVQGTPKESDIERAEANLEIAQVQLSHAEKQYELLKKGPDPDLVDLAQSRLKNSRAQLAAAQKKLVELELKAPFDGTIVSLEIKAGQSVNQTIPAILLADLEKWQVETTDLLESDLRYIQIDMPARISLDAFPDNEFEGRVKSIDLFGEESRGAASYAVLFDFDPGEVAVRWRMTAFIDIQVNGQ
jgi:multidrug resistance efflux pump